MPIESGTTISQLDESWPLGTDPTSSGDNHLRLIKAVLKAQFPGEAGDGLADIIDATEAEMNYLVGVTSSIQEQIDNLQLGIDNMFPVGHHLFTVNTANPATYGYPGTWILLESDMSIQTSDVGTVGSTPGDNEVLVPVPLHNHNATFSGNTLPTHSHGIATKEWGDPRDYPGRSSDSGDPATDDIETRPVSAGTPSGSVSVSDAGTSGATIDVRGKRKNLLCWERTL